MSAESRKAGLNVTLMVSGSIACYKACELTSMLVKDGHAVQVVATRAALRFVGRASFEGLCDRPVYSSLWTPRDSKVHITLRRWTDLYIFYPATANRVNRLASGLAEDIVGAAFLANSFEKPFWIAPAANEGMLRHPATQAAVRKLQDWGCEILLGERGRLACGDNGEGRLAEPEAVAGLVRAFHRSKMRAARARARRVLITGGGMTEPIDSVRFIANRSSGRTAAAISAAFLDRGWEVRLLCHDTATDERCEGADIRRYGTYGELAALLGASLSEQPWDAVVHSAAVSDYRLAGGRYDGKIESDGPLDLRLEKNPKLLDSIKPQARAAGYPEPFLVAFKLSSGADERAAESIVAAYLDKADRVLWNDASALDMAARPFILFGPPSDGPGSSSPPLAVARGDGNPALAAAILGAAEAAASARETP